jgi:hypothetical protein
MMPNLWATSRGAARCDLWRTGALSRFLQRMDGSGRHRHTMPEKPMFFDEMLGSGHDRAGALCRSYNGWFSTEDIRDLRKKSLDAETFFRRTGITFNVYGRPRPMNA